MLIGRITHHHLPSIIDSKMSTKEVKVTEDHDQFSTTCPPDLIFYSSIYDQVIKGANRFMVQRRILSIVFYTVYFIIILIAIGCVATSIALAVHFQLLAVGLGGGIGSVVASVIFILICMYGSAYVDDEIVKKLQRFVKSKSGDNIQIKCKKDTIRYTDLKGGSKKSRTIIYHF